MKTIITVIAFPITLTISILCFLFVLLFESNFQTKEGVSAMERIEIESRTLLLNEAWDKAPYIFKGIISIVIYYLIFF